MNIAFSTLLILFLLSPGFAIRYTFLKGPYSRQNFKPSVSEDIFWSVIPAVLIQLLGIEVQKWSGTDISLADIYYLLVGTDQANLNFNLINNSILYFIEYSLALILLSGFLGFVGRRTITRFDLDKKSNIFKISNEWYYLFSGRILDNYKEIEFIQVDVLVHSEQDNLIYCGILQSYFLTSNGGIDRIYLSNVYRRNLSSDLNIKNQNSRSLVDKEFDARYYNMPGDYFVLFGKEILNLNLTYYKLEEDQN